MCVAVQSRLFHSHVFMLDVIRDFVQCTAEDGFNLLVCVCLAVQFARSHGREISSSAPLSLANSVSLLTYFSLDCCMVSSGIFCLMFFSVLECVQMLY